MAQAISPTQFNVPLKLNLRLTNLTEEQLFLLCQENEELRFEYTAQKELIIMPLVGALTSLRNAKLTAALVGWTQGDGTGIAFASNAGFILPNGALRSPDASWIVREKWETLTKRQRERFAPLCPDFVAELRSEADHLEDLHAKMQEYIDNGARLGWLIDPIDKRVHIYRPGQSVEILDSPASLSGDPVLPGFVLRVQELW
jgi:Uma2 family endonuclease